MADMTQKESQLPITNCLDNQCPGCHSHFVCDLAQGREHCWCMKLPAVLPVVEHAKCLCPDCLAKAIDEVQSAAVADESGTESSS